MKKNITIFSNLNSYYFLEQILINYNISHQKINNLNIEKDFDKGGVVFYYYKKEDKVNLNNFNKDYLFFTNYNKQKHINKKNITFCDIPAPPEKISNLIEKFLTNKKKKFLDIYLNDNNLFNYRTNKKCSLTEIEKEIFIYLIENKTCNKNFIKKYILKIKSNVETNSLDSHLTRIRKKLEKIESFIKIHSKGDELIIISN